MRARCLLYAPKMLRDVEAAPVRRVQPCGRAEMEVVCARWCAVTHRGMCGAQRSVRLCGVARAKAPRPCLLVVATPTRAAIRLVTPGRCAILRLSAARHARHLGEARRATRPSAAAPVLRRAGPLCPSFVLLPAHDSPGERVHRSSSSQRRIVVQRRMRQAPFYRHACWRIVVTPR